MITNIIESNCLTLAPKRYWYSVHRKAHSLRRHKQRGKKKEENNRTENNKSHTCLIFKIFSDDASYSNEAEVMRKYRIDYLFH